MKVKGHFSKGRPADRADMVLRTIFGGMTVLVAPSPLTPPELIPNEGERWEVELETEFLSYDEVKKVAKIHCHPVRELPELPVGSRLSGKMKFTAPERILDEDEVKRMFPSQTVPKARPRNSAREARRAALHAAQPAKGKSTPADKHGQRQKSR
jgi:hypothetical protein